MAVFIDRYVNPFTDYGFKRLFGEEPSKPLLLDFLNELLRDEEGTITELTYIKNENLADTSFERSAIFDLYCVNERGEKFIVELQKAKQQFFKDRTVYYSTFPIRDQALKGGEWNFELKKVYMIAILDFTFDDDKENKDKYRYDVKLTDQENQKVFYDKLYFIYLSMPKFNKTIDELETKFDKWLYVLKNLSILNRVPEKLRETIFEKLFEKAEIAKFTRQEYEVYEYNLKVYWDLKNTYDYKIKEGLELGIEKGLEEGMKKGIEQGIEKGRNEEKYDIARNALKMGLSVESIIKLTGLSESEINLVK